MVSAKDDNDNHDIEESRGSESEEEQQAEILQEEDQRADEIEKLKKELATTKLAAEGYLSKLKYLMADFDNYRKQMERQVTSRVETIKAELLLKFLNIRDDYQRAVESAKQKKSEPAVIEGLEGILKNIDSLLSSEGIRPIEAIGTPFDPNVHDAIAFAPREEEETPENTVTSEIRRGYMLNDKVLRPTLVEIAKKISKNSESANNGNAGE